MRLIYDMIIVDIFDVFHVLGTQTLYSAVPLFLAKRFLIFFSVVNTDIYKVSITYDKRTIYLDWNNSKSTVVLEKNLILNIYTILCNLKTAKKKKPKSGIKKYS